jgi:hypothetical protein
MIDVCNDGDAGRPIQADRPGRWRATVDRRRTFLARGVLGLGPRRWLAPLSVQAFGRGVSARSRYRRDETRAASSGCRTVGPVCRSASRPVRSTIEDQREAESAASGGSPPDDVRHGRWFVPRGRTTGGGVRPAWFTPSRAEFTRVGHAGVSQQISRQTRCRKEGADSE